MIRKIVIQYFLGFTGINEALYTKVKMKKINYFLIAMVILYTLGLGLWLYHYQLVQVLDLLIPMNLEAQLLGIGIVSCLLLGLVTAWLRCSNILFSSPDLSFWLCLPLTNIQIVSGKMLIGYIFVWIPTLILMVPPIYLVGKVIEASLGFYVLGLLGATVLSIPVFILGTGIGILTQVLFKGLSSKSTFIKIFISFLLVLGVMIFSFTAGNYDWNRFWQQNIDYMLVSRWIDLVTSQYIKLLFDFSWIRTGLYFLLHLGLIGLFIGIINRYYQQILTQFKPKQIRKQTKNISYKETSQFMTLYKREFKRYFSSSIYVLNTMFNEVLLVVFTVLPFTIVEMILTTWLTVAYSVFSALFGLICNLKFPVFNWQTEANVVKQSISVLVSLLGGILAVMVPVFVGIRYLSIEMSNLLIGLAIYSNLD